MFAHPPPPSVTQILSCRSTARMPGTALGTGIGNSVMVAVSTPGVEISAADVTDLINSPGGSPTITMPYMYGWTSHDVFTTALPVNV